MLNHLLFCQKSMFLWKFFSILSQGSFVFYMFPNFYQFYVSEIYYGTSFSYRLHFLDFDSYKVQGMLLVSSFLLVSVYQHNSNMTSSIVFINTAVIKLLIYFNILRIQFVTYIFIGSSALNVSIYSENRLQSPKTIKTWTTKHQASLNQWYNTG